MQQLPEKILLDFSSWGKARWAKNQKPRHLKYPKYAKKNFLNKPKYAKFSPLLHRMLITKGKNHYKCGGSLSKKSNVLKGESTTNQRSMHRSLIQKHSNVLKGESITNPKYIPMHRMLITKATSTWVNFEYFIHKSYRLECQRCIKNIT